MNALAKGDRQFRRTPLMPARRSRGRKDRGDIWPADVLVNNAGRPSETFEETTLEELDRLIDIKRPRHLRHDEAALKQMNDGGRIIMIGSAVVSVP